MRSVTFPVVLIAAVAGIMAAEVFTTAKTPEPERPQTSNLMLSESAATTEDGVSTRPAAASETFTLSAED